MCRIRSAAERSEKREFVGSDYIRNYYFFPSVEKKIPATLMIAGRSDSPTGVLLFEISKKITHKVKKFILHLLNEIAAAEPAEQVGKRENCNNSKDNDAENFFFTHNAPLFR